LSQKRAVIFANGVAADINRLAAIIQPDDLLIAADGGLHYLLQLGRWPQFLIGDLDSVSVEEVELARQNGAAVHKYPVGKNETDLQLAMDFAVHAGCSSIVIAAALGGRLDQTLGNIFLLTRPDLKEIDIRLDDGMEEVFVIRNQAEINGQPGDTVSLLPYGEPVKEVKTQNLRYPLNYETLLADHTRGISNVMETTQAIVSISRGILICIHTRQVLPVKN
jgi:thiamine pyrophosphokinase